jgi:hypothetical protein
MEGSNVTHAQLGISIHHSTRVAVRSCRFVDCVEASLYSGCEPERQVHTLYVVCVCVCFCARISHAYWLHANLPTTQMKNSIVYACVCVCVCARACVRVDTRNSACARAVLMQTVNAHGHAHLRRVGIETEDKEAHENSRIMHVLCMDLCVYASMTRKANDNQA